MSKKKANPSKKKPARPVKKAAAAASGITRFLGVAPTTKRTSQATIFLTQGPGGLQIRTAPQYITAGPGFIEWTVVNMTGGDDIPVEISFPKGGPWGGEKITIRDGWIRRSCHDALDGTFKYTVTAGGVSEDPEIEIPEN